MNRSNKWEWGKAFNVIIVKQFILVWGYFLNTLLRDNFNIHRSTQESVIYSHVPSQLPNHDKSYFIYTHTHSFRIILQQILDDVTLFHLGIL